MNLSSDFFERHRRRIRIAIILGTCLTLFVWYTFAQRKATIQCDARMLLSYHTHGYGRASFRAEFETADSNDKPKSYASGGQWFLEGPLALWFGEDFFSDGIYCIHFSDPTQARDGRWIAYALAKVRPYMEVLQDTEVVEIYQTRADDVALMQLEGMKNLRFVIADGTKITPAGVKKLQEKLPGVRVLGVGE
jgi:hypothetical protein